MVRVRRLHALVGPGRSRGDDLSARGLSARYAGSVRSAVEELGGQTLSGLEFGGCLEMIVKVWLRRVTAVAAAPQRLTSLHPLPRLNPDAAALQMDQKGELSIAVVQNHMVSKRLPGIHLSRYIVGDCICSADDDTVPGGEHWKSPAEVALVPRWIPCVGAALTHDKEVVRETLIRSLRVVVLQHEAPAPGDEPLAGER